MTNLGWFVEISSIQENEFGRMLVGSEIFWPRPWEMVRESTLVVSVMEGPFFVALTLKSSLGSTKKGI